MQRLRKQQADEPESAHSGDTAVVRLRLAIVPTVADSAQVVPLPYNPCLQVSGRSSHAANSLGTAGPAFDDELSPISLPLPLPPLQANLADLAHIEISLAGLSVGDVDALVGKYFAHIHPCYPLVDREWFLDRLHSGEPFRESQSVFATMLLTICALTMAFVSDVLCDDARESFKARRDTIMSVIVLRHYMQPLGQGTTLEQVITTFLMGLYFAIVFGDKAGHFRIAEAAHLAKSMGLHCRDTYLGMDQEARRRSLAVFSCVMPSNRSVASSP